MCMNIILCASKSMNRDIEYNKTKIIEQLKKPINKKIEFIFFGEAYLNGFDSLSWNFFEDKLFQEETMNTVKYLGEMAKKYNRGLGFGYFEFVDSTIYSSYIVYDSNGDILCNYRRITTGWRFDHVNTNYYKEGNLIGEFVHKGKHFGISLCGDIWDDSLYNELLNKNFDVMVWPVYLNYEPIDWEDKEKDEYIKRSKGTAEKVLFINSVSDEPARGGTFFLDKGKLIKETKMSSKETYLLINLSF